ncbi:cupin domain-containing protein [Catenuloplanes japonicus]|uniref:cupin domain-containing protein n=1 Tax=Catenuloplanes japonicus TaxID=33876 RepID=UPI00068A32B3|nr:cupin domain-containing protein [Catenuloplanes japonicus]
MSFDISDRTPALPAARPLHVPAGEGLVKWMSGDEYTIKATRADTGGSLSFIDAIVPPGGGPVAHVHGGEDEAFFILDGELEFLDGDRTFTGKEGDFVFVPRGHRHRFKNIIDRPVRTLFLFTPGGFEDFFIQAGDDPQPGRTPPVWDMSRFQQIGDLVARADMTLLPETP